MIRELDVVALNVNLPAHGLKKGDVGTVVLLHRNGEMEVEFVTYSGNTVALVHLEPRQVRALGAREVPHARRRQTGEPPRGRRSAAR